MISSFQTQAPLGGHTKSAPSVGGGFVSVRGASGGAAQESTLLELEEAVVDVEGVRHHDGVRDALPAVS